MRPFLTISAAVHLLLLWWVAPWERPVEPNLGSGSPLNVELLIPPPPATVREGTNTPQFASRMKTIEATPEEPPTASPDEADRASVFRPTAPPIPDQPRVNATDHATPAATPSSAAAVSLDAATLMEKSQEMIRNDPMLGQLEEGDFRRHLVTKRLERIREMLPELLTQPHLRQREEVDAYTTQNGDTRVALFFGGGRRVCFEVPRHDAATPDLQNIPALWKLTACKSQ